MHTDVYPCCRMLGLRLYSVLPEFILLLDLFPWAGTGKYPWADAFGP